MATKPRIAAPDEHSFLAQDDISYLKRKNGGGLANRTGYDFELIVATRCVLSDISLVRLNRLDPTSVHIAVQIDGFVDDFVVVRDGFFEWFEMKSGASASWSGGDRPIARNFELQRYCDKRFGRNSFYNLVLSSEFACNAILKDKGLTYRNVTVSQFPNHSIESELTALHLQFSSLLDEVSQSPDEDEDDRVVVTDEDKIQAFLAIRTAVYETKPSQLRSMSAILHWCDLRFGSFSWRRATVDADVLEILRAIPGASFVVSRQRLHYNLGKFEGQVPFIIGTSEFKEFEVQVSAVVPSTCIEFRQMLRAMERKDG